MCLSVNSSLRAASEPTGDYSEMLNTMNSVQGEVKKSGVIEDVCTNCFKLVEPHKKIELSNKEVDLDQLPLMKDNEPYIIHVKRTKDSPLKATLKFKNGHSECGKMYVGTNPWNPRGDLMIGCLYTHTVFEDHEIDLNLKKLPLPVGDEEQIIEIKITKPNVQNSYYSLDADIVKGPSAKVSKDKKFWNSGYNVDIQAADGK